MSEQTNKMFAKLYNTHLGQILVKVGTNEGADDGCPEVKIYFQLKGFGIVTVAKTFPDNNNGWKRRNKFFEDMTEEQATSIVADTIQKLS